MISDERQIQEFLRGKSTYTIMLYKHFLNEYGRIGEIKLYPTKTMIGIAKSQKKIAWITQLGKNFIHVVFPFETVYKENLCFQKIVQVPGDTKQFNHHFRMLLPEDVNEEVISFMKMAYGGQ